MKKGDDIHKGYITLDEFLAWYEHECRNMPKDAATKVGWPFLLLLILALPLVLLFFCVFFVWYDRVCVVCVLKLFWGLYSK